MNREPCTPEKNIELDEEMAVVADRSAGEVFGNPSIPPSRYRCPQHGEILAQDAVWKRDSRAYCPMCDAALGKVE